MLTEKQQRVFRKMKATMALVRYHGMEKKTWCGDTPEYWTAIKTRILWESIQNGFKQKYYTIQRKANGTSKRQPTKRKKKIEIKQLHGQQYTIIVVMLVY